MIRIKTEDEVALMRESSRIVAAVLRLLGAQIRPGISTQELDRMAEDFIRSNGGVPSFKGYGHDPNNLFPASICTSIDHEIVHGIPGARTLREGEMISIDVGVCKAGFHGDGASTFAVGMINPEKKRLLRVTKESLEKGIAKAIEGNRVSDISHAVQTHVEAAGFSVVRDLVGHGVGADLHEEPAVPNFGRKGTGIELKEGMTLAIEPMVNAGTYRVKIAPDGWTVETHDGKPSAHFEHTIVVRRDRAQILTK
jgi:methionyl aminopeptidase